MAMQPRRNPAMVDRTEFGRARRIQTVLLAVLWVGWGVGVLGAVPATARNAAWPAQVGLVSFYGPGPRWHRTASGTVFNPRALTAASAMLPLGARVRITVLASGRSVVVTVNDRMPRSARLLDLSLRAARALGIVHQGVAWARVRRLP